MENSTVEITCINNNVGPFSGSPYWINPFNVTISINGLLLINSVSRNQAGTYTCGINKMDPSVMVDIKNISFYLEVNCKLRIMTFHLLYLLYFFVCMCVCVFVCMHACICECMHAYVNACVCTCMRGCVHAYVRVCE